MATECEASFARVCLEASCIRVLGAECLSGRFSRSVGVERRKGALKGYVLGAEGRGRGWGRGRGGREW